MQVKQQVNVSPEKFYQNLLQVFKNEYAYHTGQEVVEIDVEIAPGIEYTVSNEIGSYHVKLHELLLNERYESLIHSNRGETHIVYEIHPGETVDSAWVTYTENTTGDGFFQRMNGKFIGFFFQKKMTEALQQKIEQIAQL